MDRAPAASLPNPVFLIWGFGRGSRALAACWSSWPLLSLDLASVHAWALGAFDAAELGSGLLTLPVGPDGGVEDMIARRV